MTHSTLLSDFQYRKLVKLRDETKDATTLTNFVRDQYNGRLTHKWDNTKGDYNAIPVAHNGRTSFIRRVIFTSEKDLIWFLLHI